RCTQVATGIAMPSPSVDALGRELESFESYSIDPIDPIDPAAGARNNVHIRFTGLIPAQAKPTPTFLMQTTYDGAGRPLLVESRLAVDDNFKDYSHPGTVKGAPQYRYSIVDGPPLPRFEALSLSPRCTASAIWSDARGLKRTVFEDQRNFYPAASELRRSDLPDPANDPANPLDEYRREYGKARGYCDPIERIAGPPAVSKQAPGNVADQVSPILHSYDPYTHISYSYDPLQQLESVD